MHTPADYPPRCGTDSLVVLTPYPDGALRYKAPKGRLTPELLDAIRQHKQELLDLLEAFEERAAIAQYEGGLERQAVEALAWACVRGEEAP